MMRNVWRRWLIVVVIVGLASIQAGSFPARVYAVVDLTLPDVAYTQNFNSLAMSGSATWNDDATINGWYSSRTTYIANAGNTNTGSLYSYGSNGSGERALGSRASDNTGDVKYGVLLHNLTGDSIPNLAISYTGEQWRFGNDLFGNDDPDIDQTISVTYRMAATPITSLTAGTWLPISALTFHSPDDRRDGSGMGANALNGNLAANRVLLGAIITPTSGFVSGAYMMVRWYHPNDPLDDHGLAIDDVEIVPFLLDPTAVTWAQATLLVNPTRSNPGGIVTYRLAVSDPEGGAFAVEDTFDPRLTIISAPDMNVDGQTVRANGLLAPSERRVFSMTVQVAPDFIGVLENSATITGDGASRTVDAPAVMVLHTVYLPLVRE